MNRPTVDTASRRQFIGGTLAAFAAARLIDPPELQAQQRGRPFVLVHGAWHGGWCWRRVVGGLTAKGRYVVAPTLSGVGERSHLASDAINLSTHIDDVVNEIKWKDLDNVVLVGHSYAGMVITGVAERVRERIAAIVYLDAFLPHDGASLAALVATRTTWPEHVAPPIPAATLRVDAKDAAWVDSKMTPHPVKCFTDPLSVSGAYLAIPQKIYIRARGYQSAAFDAAFDRCRKDQGWKTIEMQCGHDVMIDQPAELVAILEPVG